MREYKIELTKEQLELHVHTVNSLVINSDSQLELANELARYSSDQAKEIKAKYKPQKQDLEKQKKAIIANEKDELKPYENAKTVIKNAIARYIKKVEQQKIEQDKKIKEEKEKYGISLESIQETSKLKGTHIRKMWKARVVDADKVPDKIGKIVIREINMSVLNEFAKTYQGEFEIPGVEFYQDEAVVIR